jgi:diguanylate cyclase (GGDEF)-like protein
MTAATIKAQARTTDLASRYGGEEFCILLTETGAEQAPIFAERLRLAVEQTECPLDRDEVLRVTCSLGIAPYEKGIFDTVGFIRRADKALYRAKHTGRNRVCIYDPALDES